MWVLTAEVVIKAEYKRKIETEHFDDGIDETRPLAEYHLHVLLRTVVLQHLYSQESANKTMGEVLSSLQAQQLADEDESDLGVLVYLSDLFNYAQNSIEVSSILQHSY
jgi:hypothetical protein